MNLSRSLSRFLPSSNPKKWSLLLRSSSFCTKFQTSSPTRRCYKRNLNPNPSKKLPRPAEIPFQAAVTNHVQLVGSIGVPVQLQSLPTGVFAVSVLVQEMATKDPPHLCIPVIFQGDLAQIAAFHLKENDFVHVSGRLSGDASSQTVEDAQGLIQVLANTLTFVQNTCPERVSEMGHDQDDTASGCSGVVNKSRHGDGSLWNDLVDNSQQWWDKRGDKLNGSVSAKFPDFKHKSTQKGLWLESAPDWVLLKLDSLVFCGNDGSDRSSSNKPLSQNIGSKSDIAKNGKAEVEKNLSNLNLWNDLLAHPENWWDIRSSMCNPAHAAFKHKKNSQQLWLNDSTPEGVLAKLDALFRRAPSSDVNKSRHGDGSLWNDLVDASQQWWDKRGDKLNGSVSAKFPDFKHKITQKGLWLESAPDWVLLKLDSLVFCGNDGGGSSSSNKPLSQINGSRGDITKNEKGKFLQYFLLK